jgi:CubicO group peptidase (beta-lactamase class C family)
VAVWKWILAITVAVVLAALAGLSIYYHPDRAIRLATGHVAHLICSKTFVSGLDPQTVLVETLERPGFRRLRHVMDFRIDRKAGTVEASTLGLFTSHAAFHEGFGCVEQHGAKQPYLLKSDIEALKVPKTPPLLAEIAGPAVVEPSDPALKAALDHAFEEPAEPPSRRTKAVVVVRDGKVIAERYASGIGIDTQLSGFSMTKSMVNALIGVLTQQGLTSPSLPAPIPEWRRMDDPRREIEVEHLMRMTSGLDLDETNSGFDRSTRMYLYNDMSAYAVNTRMIAPIGKRFHYSSATTQILARIIRDLTGGPEQTLTYAWRELFNPLGMRNVTLEFDGTGTLQGANYMLASARDWAKLGVLFVNDGVIGGKKVLHPDWVDFCAAATLDSDYAAGFFTNRSDHPNAKARVRLGMPRDSFFASGLLGQRIVIVPSHRLVVVRLGDTVEPSGDIKGVARLVKEVIGAIGH